MPDWNAKDWLILFWIEASLIPNIQRGHLRRRRHRQAVPTLANCLLKFFFTQTFLFYSIFWGEKTQFFGQNSFSVSEIIFALSDSSNWYEDLRCYFIFCYRFKMCIFLVWASIVILVLLRSRDVKSGLKNWLWFGHKRLLTELAGLVDYFSFSDPTRSRERERERD